MFIKDLTEEQAIKLARLCTIEEWIQEDKGFEAQYLPYDPEMWSDAREAYEVTYHSLSFGDTVDLFCFTLYPSLDVGMSYIRKDGHHALPVRNQYQLFEAIRELGLEQNSTCERCYKQIPYKRLGKPYQSFCTTCKY